MSHKVGIQVLFEIFWYFRLKHPFAASDGASNVMVLVFKAPVKILLLILRWPRMVEETRVSRKKPTEFCRAN